MLCKKEKFILFVGVQLFLLFFFIQTATADSTLVRIRTDVDISNFQINDSSYITDSYNNPLSANNWFLIHLSNGEYRFSLQYREQQIDTSLIIENQESIALEISFLHKNEILKESDLPKLYITSNPDSGFITLDGKTLDILTPTFISIPKDTISVEVYKDGYIPLVTDLMIKELQKKQVKFILMPMEPAPLNADSLGYTLEKPIQPLDIRAVDKIKNKYIGMAETFMIFPFAQGLIAKIVLDEDNQTEANILVGSGAILSAGSYILSKILSKRKSNEIKERNVEIDRQNLEIKSSNKEIELIVRKANAEKKVKWKEKSANKGVVEIISE